MRDDADELDGTDTWRQPYLKAAILNQQIRYCNMVVSIYFSISQYNPNVSPI